MKMGIERVLRENFPSLNEVISVTSAVPAGEQLTLEAVQDALKPILPAVKAMGGAVEVVAVDGTVGVVRVKYQGPSKLKQGVELVLKDLKLVTAVDFVD